MKNLILNATLTLLICLLSANVKAARHNKLDSMSCLQIEGRIINANDGMDGECIVELIGLDDAIDTIILKEGKRKFKFILNKNSYYAIRVSKKGYISKFVSVNTEILTENNGVHIFEFETSLVREEIKEILNKDILDFPVAIIHYDYEIETFSYNKEYSAYVKREMHSKPLRKNKKSETLAPLNTRVMASAYK